MNVHRSRSPRPGRGAPVIPLILLIALLLAPASARAADSLGVNAPDGATPADMAPVLLDLGLENVGYDRADGPRLAFENRRFRHTMDVLGRIRRETGAPFTAVERRFGLVAAAVDVEGDPDHPRIRVRYPTDSDFPGAPSGPRLAPTSHSVDFVVGPVVAYELGRLTTPWAFRVEVHPRVRYNPWPGALLTASMVFPVHNDFSPTELNPDIDEVRPGVATLQQFAWVPRVALASGTVGVFADNRYGLSLGAARPMWEGALLLDGQVDFTGFLGFPPEGVVYSGIERWSGFAGATWRAPWYDVAVTGRVSHYLYGDDGPEVIFKRSIGDLDLSLSIIRSSSIYQKTVLVTLPVPPLVRSTKHPVRTQLIERFPASYRTEANPVGVHVGAVASREEFLRQLSRPGLEANRERFAAAYGTPWTRPTRPVDWISLSGMTGFINTPWVGVMRDKGLALGYNRLSKKWSYDERGKHANEVYHATVGVLPQLEASFRWTRIPGRLGFLPDDPDNELTTDTDHMASARLMLLTPRHDRPGLAIGVEDVEGTRRFHSTYIVTGMPIEIKGVQSRISLGYAPDVFTATRHVLDGGFGAFEISPWRAVAARVEHDSEKMNVGIGVDLGFGLRLRAAALNLETLGVGVGWFHEL